MGETFYDAPHNSFGSLAARGPDNDEERCPFDYRTSQTLYLSRGGLVPKWLSQSGGGRLASWISLGTPA